MPTMPHYNMAEFVSHWNDDSSSLPSSRPCVCVLEFPCDGFDLLVCVQYRREDDGSIFFNPDVKEVVFDEFF